MSEGYRHRHVRPLFPEIANSVCDCELLPKEYCCQREDLVHTEEQLSSQCECVVDDGRQTVSYTSEHRRCSMCGQIWWLYSQSRTDHTYARDDEYQIVGSVSYATSYAVRCADTAELVMLDAWLPCYFAALARRDRLFVQNGGRPNDQLRAAVRECIALSERSAATRLLGDTSARAKKMSSALRTRLFEKMRHCIAQLETQPEDLACWTTLQEFQLACANARLDDPARELSDWTIEEWWTPALAGIRPLEFEIHALRQSARGKTLGSLEHRTLRNCEDAIAKHWIAHLAQVKWPHQEAAFMALLTHAQLLEPLVVARDMASWVHPDRIGRLLKDLLATGQVQLTRHIVAAPWLALRTGLPDARARHLTRTAAGYWLPIRRARRAAGQPNSNV